LLGTYSSACELNSDALQLLLDAFFADNVNLLVGREFEDLG
jgi:hypothetical protein